MTRAKDSANDGEVRLTDPSARTVGDDPIADPGGTRPAPGKASRKGKPERQVVESGDRNDMTVSDKLPEDPKKD